MGYTQKAVELLYVWVYARLLSLVERNAEFYPTARGRQAFARLEASLPTVRAFAAMDTRAQGGNLVSLVIGIAVAVIVGVGVSIPIVNDVIASSNLTGLTATIVGFIPVMLGVLIFVATVGPIMRRT